MDLLLVALSMCQAPVLFSDVLNIQNFIQPSQLGLKNTLIACLLRR